MILYHVEIIWKKTLFCHTCFNKTFPITNWYKKNNANSHCHWSQFEIFSFVNNIYGIKQTYNYIKIDPMLVNNINIFIVRLWSRWDENKFNMNKPLQLSIEDNVRKTSNDKPAVCHASTK